MSKANKPLKKPKFEEEYNKKEKAKQSQNLRKLRKWKSIRNEDI
jgi:hypothetical protein